MKLPVLFLCVLLVASAALAGESENVQALEGGFSVKDFGAKGDGATDDTMAIQAAMDAAAIVGGRVHLPPAKYLVKGSLNVPAGVHVRGVADAPRFNAPMTGSIIQATWRSRDKFMLSTT